jgi:hypothetical protein
MNETTEKLKSAYNTTITDLNIALSNSGLFEFKYKRELRKSINKFEKLLKLLK